MKIKDIALQSLIAAMYVVVTFAFASLSYQGLQFRISELLLLLVLFNKKHTVGVVLGCFIANLIGPFGFIDAVFGSLATLVACGAMTRIKDHRLALLTPALANGLIVGAYVSAFESIPFAITALQIAFGEFVVTFVMGMILLPMIKNNKKIVELVS